MSSAIINTDSQEPGQGDLSDMIQRYTAYNLWANQQMAEWLQTASEEAINQEVESSFSSIKETIFHIWNAEYLWLQTVKKEVTDNSPVKTFDGGKDELVDGWLEASENFTNYVSSMSLSDLQDQRPRSRFRCLDASGRCARRRGRSPAALALPGRGPARYRCPR